METAHVDDGGSGQGGGRRGGIVSNTRRMPGATEKLGDGDPVGKQAGSGSNGWQTQAFAGTQAARGESGQLEGDETSTGDAPEGAEPAVRSQASKMWVVDAWLAADVLQASDRWVLCTAIGTNRGTTHGREGSDTTAPR